ncbi:SufD family Fe-S cluster assembly protein [Beijerinckia sp. L45]|uniref:SufB/SufD family protein n=1 Tax=Beijerinckia sp. L45 TaxID=1641855 RepID=UPI00131B9420|nr:SufD family Fe-S cluster assembly protein [Beijerinckia sp. L45]
MVARIVSTRTDAEVSLADTFGSAKATLPGNAVVKEMRETAFGAFAAHGLPHRRIEAWHYTDLRSMMREALPLAPLPDVRALEAVRVELAAAILPAGPRLLIVDGTYVPTLSDALPEGATVRSLADVLAEGRADLIDKLAAAKFAVGDSIVALNAALMQDGVVIEVAPGAVIAEPIHIVYATAAQTPVARFFRSLVVVGAGAKILVTESSLGAGGRVGQTFGALIFDVADRAEVGHTCMMTKTEPGSLRLDTFIAELGADVTFSSFALVHGEGLMRRQLFLRCVGDNTKAALNGVSLLKGRDHADTTLDVEHIGLGCEGRETFRYILDDSATGVFQGRIRVAPGAQKTDGKMMSRALLLSDDVVMNNKPELEIFADDVACGHGATCGGLNEDQLFYMQARGISRAEAESLLLEAFASELADNIGHEGLTAAFRAEVADWLAARTVKG